MFFETRLFSGLTTVYQKSRLDSKFDEVFNIPNNEDHDFQKIVPIKTIQSLPSKVFTISLNVYFDRLFYEKFGQKSESK